MNGTELPDAEPLAGPDLGEMMSPREVARLLRVHRNTVYLWITRGDLPALQVGRQNLLVSRRDVLRLLRPVVPRSGADRA